MKDSRTRIQSVLIIGLWLLASADEAYGYIDPGTGSYVLQMTIAALLGASFAIKIYWRKIKAFFVDHFSKRQKYDVNKD